MMMMVVMMITTTTTTTTIIIIIIIMLWVITGVNGTILKIAQFMNNIPEKHEIKEIQKRAILGTAHILWKVLIQKYKALFADEITLHVA
jgi:hypothetical protein